LLFTGGALLKEAFDADYERQERYLEPIPGGGISQKTIWRWGLGLLAMGALLLLWTGVATGALGLTMVFLIVAYDFTHRVLIISPVLEGLSRFFVYILAASFARPALMGWPIWCGFALGLYVGGTSYLEHGNSRPRSYWPFLFLASPLFFALVMDVGPYRESALLLVGLVVLWVLKSLRPVLWPTEPAEHISVEELYAGIVLVDWLAACPGASFTSFVNQTSRQISFAFIAFFVLALCFQRIVRGSGRYGAT
jgi:4-hydroxybenzoate polyprenyltransferase